MCQTTSLKLFRHEHCIHLQTKVCSFNVHKIKGGRHTYKLFARDRDNNIEMAPPLDVEYSGGIEDKHPSIEEFEIYRYVPTPGRIHKGEKFIPENGRINADGV